MATQDWNQVVLTKKKPASGTTVKDVDAVRRVAAARRTDALLPFGSRGARAGAQARRAGAQVAAVKKCARARPLRPPAARREPLQRVLHSD